MTPVLRPASRRAAGPCLAVAVLAGTAFASAPHLYAQGLPFNIGTAVRSTEQTQEAAPQPRPSSRLVLPQLAEPQFTMDGKETLLVRHIVVTGTDDLSVSEEDVRALLAPYEGRKLTLADIYAAADKVTTLYRTAGYLVAKTYVPAQDARKGTLTFKLLPGQYGTVAVNNSSLVQESVLQGILHQQKVAAGNLISQDGLERAMLLISDLSGAGMPRSVIGAGAVQGASDFLFDVPPENRIDGFLLGDNFGSPYTGRAQASAGLNWNSPLGIGDRLSLFGMISQSTDLANARAAYSVPMGYDGLRAEVSAFRTTYALGNDYADLDATGVADGLSASLLYPFKRTRNDSIWGTLTYTYKTLDDLALDISYAHRRISEGTFALNRDTAGAVFDLPFVTSTSVALTFGNVAFPDQEQALNNADGANTAGSFAKIVGSFNATLALAEKLSLSLDLRGQKSFSGNLDSSEQFSLTGVFGVRSYDEGLSGDSGWLVTPELKYALPDLWNWHHAVSAFADIGGAALEDGSYTTLQPNYIELGDAGLGYYGNYEYSPGRQLLVKAYVAWTVGGHGAAAGYDRGTVGLVQAGFTF